MSGGAAWLPVVARIAMPFGQSTVVLSMPHRDHAARLSPSAPGGGCRSLWRRDTRQEETSNPGGRSPSMHPLKGAAFNCQRWAEPSPTHRSESRFWCRRGGRSPMWRVLIQPAHRVRAGSARTYSQSHSLHTGWRNLTTFCGEAAGEAVGRSRRPAR